MTRSPWMGGEHGFSHPFGNDEDVKYTSDGTFTTGNTTIEDGAVVRFVSHGEIVIQPGFEVESGGKLMIETW